MKRLITLLVLLFAISIPLSMASKPANKPPNQRTGPDPNALQIKKTSLELQVRLLRKRVSKLEKQVKFLIRDNRRNKVDIKALQSHQYTLSKKAKRQTNPPNSSSYRPRRRHRTAVPKRE